MPRVARPAGKPSAPATAAPVRTMPMPTARAARRRPVARESRGARGDGRLAVQVAGRPVPLLDRVLRRRALATHVHDVGAPPREWASCPPFAAVAFVQVHVDAV